MRLSRFISSLVCAIAPMAAWGCGAFDALTENPFVCHFYQENDEPTIILRQQEENIALWKKLTSGSIPDEDIQQAVYDSKLQELTDCFANGGSGNKLVSWIVTHRADDLKEFLMLAKELEELRFNRTSTWYYPASKDEPYDSRSEAEKFADVLERCERNASGRLADRYGLQHVRALMALGRYADCIRFYDTHMAQLPDSNLMKRMAKGYVAGCHRRLGDKDTANRMYAEVGDFNSVFDNKPEYFVTMVTNNPESDVVKSRLNNWIGYGTRDENLRYLRVADAALASAKVVHRGDWLFLKAWVEETYNRDHSRAISYLDQALRASFSDKTMRQDAERMSLCLKAGAGKLHSDLRDYLDAGKVGETPIFFYVVPALLKKGKINEALLLTNYASYLDSQARNTDTWASYSLVNGRNAYKPLNNQTYATTGFQLMLTRSAKEIIEYKKYLQSGHPLVEACLPKIRHDDDYLNELIGTLLLREGNYAEAEKYLSMVSEEYQEHLNVKRCGYLLDNPWANCYTMIDKWSYPASQAEAEREIVGTLCSRFDPKDPTMLVTDQDAKLNFAREMHRLEDVMRNGTPDERGLARIRHALARYNSLTSCWALTHYWKGDANQCNFRPFYRIWNGEFGEGIELDYLKESTDGYPDERWVEAQIKRGMKEIRSTEAMAEAKYLAGDYRSLAREYADSSIGRHLATHCDAWKDWL
ncbi:MAG: hypothetical protein K2H21_07955 [Muribaculaceae bacterium]|nr:hypothetical protein [Muribaculaceae bacterium]